MGNDWVVFDYERGMGVGLQLFLRPDMHAMLPTPLQNAVVEALVLHTRILTDILISKGTHSDDITLQKLLPAFDSPHVAHLANAYGDGKTLNSPCWQFNKLLAHATSSRKDTHEYLPALTAVWVHIDAVLKDIDAIRPSAGRSML